MEQVVAQKGLPTTTPAPPRGAAATLTALTMAAVSFQMLVTMPTPATLDMVDRLGTTSALVGLAQGVFFLVGGLVAVVVASYSDYSDRRRLLVGSLVVMCAGSLLAVVATNIAVLILARALQAGSGAVFPLALRIVRDILPPQRFGPAMGVITAAYGGVAGLDAIIGGWLTDAYGFRAVFAVIAVFGIVTTVLVARWVPSFRSTVAGRMDWWGAAILCLSLTIIQLGIGSANNAGLASAASFVAVGLLLLVPFWFVEKRRAHPLIPVRYLRSRQIWPVLLTSILALAGFLSIVNFTLPVLSQDNGVGLGLSATTSALLFLMPVCFVNAGLAPLAGHLAPRIGWRRMLSGGLACGVPVAIAIAAGVTSQWLLFVLVPVLGFFVGATALTAMNGLSVLLSPQDSPGVLPGLNSTCYGLGAALGITIAAQLIGVTETGGEQTSLAGFQGALWMATAAIAAAVLVSLLITAPRSSDHERV